MSKKNTERISFYLSPEDVEALEEIRKERGYKTRSDMLRTYFELVALEKQIREVDEKYMYLLKLVVEKLKETNEFIHALE